jgi:hypothetical protein
MKRASFPLIVEESGNLKSLDDYTREVKGDNLYFDAKTEPIFVYNPRAGRVRLVQNGREKKSWIDVNLSLVSGYHEINPEKESSEAATKPQENTVMGNTLLTGRLNFDPRIHKEQPLYERKAFQPTLSPRHVETLNPAEGAAVKRAHPSTDNDFLKIAYGLDDAVTEGMSKALSWVYGNVLQDPAMAWELDLQAKQSGASLAESTKHNEMEQFMLRTAADPLSYGYGGLTKAGKTGLGQVVRGIKNAKPIGYMENAVLTAAKKREIRNFLIGKPVVATPYDIIKATEGGTILSAARRWADNNAFEYVRDDIGKCVFNGRGVKNSVSHYLNRDTVNMIPAVPDVIRNGKVLDVSRDFNGQPISNIIIGAPVSLGGKHQVLMVRLRSADGMNDNRYYVHKVLSSEDLRNGPFQKGDAVDYLMFGRALGRVLSGED